jgi:hypothetical protein
MKIDRVLCLFAVVAFPQLVLAEPQFNNQVAGETQAIIDFCAQTNGVNTTKYQEQARSMFRDVSQRDLGKFQSTKEYKDAYAQTLAALDQIPNNDAVEACQGFLATSRSGTTGGTSDQDESHDARKH